MESIKTQVEQKLQTLKTEGYDTDNWNVDAFVANAEEQFNESDNETAELRYNGLKFFTIERPTGYNLETMLNDSYAIFATEEDAEEYTNGNEPSLALIGRTVTSTDEMTRGATYYVVDEHAPDYGFTKVTA